MIENIPEVKWFNYFSNMRKKYNMRVSANKPIIIFLDAKDSSKNRVNLLKSSPNDFFHAMDKTAEFFSRKYKCLTIFGTDEISFIIEETEEFIDTINNEKSYRTHDIVSIFSQYFFEEFNKVYDGETIYFHCKCFNVNHEKIESYIKFKSRHILKGVTSFFLKNQGVKNAFGIKLVDKLEMCKNYETYESIQNYKNGVLYFDGNRINIEDYLNGNIVYLEELKSNEEPEKIFDLEAFDDLF